jgi:hypothetical protein
VDHRIIDSMDRQGWTASVIAALALLCALVLVAGVALAAPPLLPADAFTTPRPCELHPFDDPSVEQREQSLSRPCGRDALKMRLFDTGPKRVGLEVDQLMTMHADDNLTASARLGWSGASDPSQPALGRALIAAGGMLKLDDNWALDLSAGHDIGSDKRTRATASALFRPTGRNLMYVELAAEDVRVVAPGVGMRWRLTDNASLDVSARRSADRQQVQPRLGFQLSGF